MPYKTDKQKLGSPFLSRRVKLLPCQKEMVKYWHERGSTINGLARMFHVNKRLIQFILFPERKAKNLADRKARGGTKQYYNKEEHKNSMKQHRRYKNTTIGTNNAPKEIKKDYTVISPKDLEKKLKDQHHIAKIRSIERMKDYYIINLLHAQYKISRESIKNNKDLIETLKQQIKLKRLLKSKKNGK